MQPQIEHEPRHLCVSIGPERKQQRNQENRSEDYEVRLHPHDKAHHDPDEKSDENDRKIADWSVRQKVSGLAHEVVTAFRAPLGCVEVAAEDLTFSANGTAKREKGSKVQAR